MMTTKTDSLSTPIERADELLREMTVEEKAMQLSSFTSLALIGPDGPLQGQLESLLACGIGHIAGIGMLGHKLPDEIAKNVNAIQRYLVSETRLKIPAIFHNEALNGVVAPGFSAFPTPLASSDDIRSTATVDVTGEPRVYAGGDRAFLSAATVM